MPKFNSKRTYVNDGDMPNKIISLSEYDVELISKVSSGNNKKNIEIGAAELITDYFENLVDAKARSGKSSLHHVYEFDMAGNKDGRLFKKNILSTGGGVKISYSLIESKIPNRNGYVFHQKAKVMESQTPVKIGPKNAKYLMFRLNNGSFIKTNKTLTIRNPGGGQKNTFRNEFNEFMSTGAENAIMSYRYYGRIISGIKSKRDSMVSKINLGNIDSSKSQAALDAASISNGVRSGTSV